MRTIIRCPNCFTYVYEDARACHGCGERIGKRKILRTGSWVFIGLAVTAFTIARGIDLEQDAQSKAHDIAERVSLTGPATEFIRAWLTDDAETVKMRIAECEQFAGDLDKLRDRYELALPATSVVAVTISETSSTSHQNHYQVDRNPVTHSSWGNPDPSVGRRESCVPPGRSVNVFRRVVDGMKKSNRSWTLPQLEFEAEFKKDGLRYLLEGTVCLDDGKVCCLTIDHVKGPEGEIKPKQQ